jgi:serine/threonine protein kinase
MEVARGKFIQKIEIISTQQIEMGKLNTSPSADIFPDMLYCSNPNCSNTFNSGGNKFCIQCGQTLSLLFRNRFRVIKLLGEGGFGKTYEARDTDKMDEPCVIKQFLPQVQGTGALEKATELFKQEAKRLYDLGEHPQIPRLIAYSRLQVSEVHQVYILVSENLDFINYKF